MKAIFIESTEFTRWVSAWLPFEAYARLQQELMEQPDKGVVLQDCGGLRKVRTPDPRRGKGKRGGLRVIYFYVSEAKRFYMLDIYDKDEKEDLSNEEKRVLAKLAAELRREALASVAKSRSKRT